jgi:DNA-directed RNA polymerase subunit H (RpoH/RPB5)
MCWIGKDIKQIAEKDISVFKIVRKSRKNNFLSYYYPKHWVLNEKQESEILKRQSNYENFVEIHTGLHSYDSSMIRIVEDHIIFQIYSYISSVPLDSFLYTENLYKMDCVIPTGSTYYENERGEIVSNALIPTKFTLIT